ncbi:MAG: hypothetical protein M0012_07265 [Deltaproteobacteria bacterium]|nr:hypothetical protein [Deltaproteobacteria bacterium]
MLKSKKSLSVLFLAIALLFLFSGAKTASAKNGIFISTLSSIAGYKIVKDYGFMAIVDDSRNNHFLMMSINGNYTEKSLYNLNHVLAVATFRIINQYKPSGANACINLKFQDGVYTSCEYVILSPKK